MRTLVLACIVALGTSSCDWHGPTSSITDFAVPAAAAQAALAPRAHDSDACAFALEDASTEDENLFFTNLSGVWRDSLGDAVESETAHEQTQEGLRFRRQVSAFSLEIGRAVVQIMPSDFSNDDLETKGFASALTSTNLRVGQTSSDGFTALQARFSITDAQKSCVTFALKVSQMADGRKVLLLRGPIEEKATSPIKPMSAFFYLVHDSTRMFTH